MKLLIRPALILLIVFLLMFVVVMLSGFNSTRAQQLAGYSNASFALQITATPPVQEDRSEIGSTYGITVMSFVIVAIVIIPILLKRKSWTQA